MMVGMFKRGLKPRFLQWSVMNMKDCFIHFAQWLFKFSEHFLYAQKQHFKFLRCLAHMEQQQIVVELSFHGTFPSAISMPTVKGPENAWFPSLSPLRILSDGQIVNIHTSGIHSHSLVCGPCAHRNPRPEHPCRGNGPRSNPQPTDAPSNPESATA